MRPVAQAYIDTCRSSSARACRNFFNNIDDLFSAVNGLLQGKLDKAGDDLGRVMINTGFGFGGLIDIASKAGIERGNEDFGQTFGVWGIPQGPYLFVPLFGPTTVRDGTGVDRARSLGPVGYIPRRAAAQRALRRRLRRPARAGARRERPRRQAALDRYTFIRNAYLQRRRYLVYDGKPPPETRSD